MRYLTGFLLGLINFALLDNVVLSRFLGLCPFLGVSKKIRTAAGMGGAVVAVITLSSAITYFINRYVLIPLDLVYMRTIAFILIIAALVQTVEIIMKKKIPSLYKALGVYLPLITTNCAVLGAAITNVDRKYTLGESLVNSFGTGLGFTLALVLFAGVRIRLESSDIPETFKGVPATLVAAAIVSLSFMGFVGIV